MKKILLVLAVLAMQMLGGCSEDTESPVIKVRLPWDRIQLRTSNYTIVAPADSTTQVWITAILRNEQGVLWPGQEITYSTMPPVQIGLPLKGVTNESGQVTFRLLFRVPADTTSLTFEAKSGYERTRLVLTLIGE